MMNGSQRGPANTRTPWPDPPCSSPTRKRDRVARRRRADAFLSLRAVAVGRIGEDAVEHELVLADGERRRIVRGSRP